MTVLCCLHLFRILCFGSLCVLRALTVYVVHTCICFTLVNATTQLMRERGEAQVMHPDVSTARVEQVMRPMVSEFVHKYCGTLRCEVISFYCVCFWHICVQCRFMHCHAGKCHHTAHAHARRSPGDAPGCERGTRRASDAPDGFRVRAQVLW